MGVDDCEIVTGVVRRDDGRGAPVGRQRRPTWSTTTRAMRRLDGDRDQQRASTIAATKRGCSTGGGSAVARVGWASDASVGRRPWSSSTAV
jgi:hypothetical protein